MKSKILPGTKRLSLPVRKKAASKKIREAFVDVPKVPVEQLPNIEVYDTYYTTTFPPLPKPSQELKQVLITFNEFSKTIPNSKKSTKIKKFKKINGFFAFRSFYSRFIKGSELQRRLSKELGVLWKKEVCKDVWVRYAYEYSKLEPQKGFVEWLCERLNIQSKKLSIMSINSKITRNEKEGIDDIILI